MNLSNPPEADKVARERSMGVPIIRRTCAFDVKKTLDSRFPILVTRCERRSKKFFGLAGFGVQVDVRLIEGFSIPP